MTFPPGTYYVGDPSRVLPADNLRLIFSLILRNRRLTGAENVSTDLSKHFWTAPTPEMFGTLYLSDGTPYGYDWGGFGCVPWECVDSYDGIGPMHEFKFTEPFECSFNQDGIKIGHLHFTFSPT